MSSTRRSRASSSEHPDSDESIARKKERLDSAILKLKEKVPGFSDEENDKTNFVGRTSKGSCRQEEKITLEGIPLDDLSCRERDCRIIPKNIILDASYCMWENTSNVCWLDASMALLSHNLTLRYESDLSYSSQLTKVIKYYNEAICTLNDDKIDSLDNRLNKSKAYLRFVQDSSLKYLQPMLKYKEGDPESAFCSLINLIGKDETIKKFFEVTFVKSLQCDKCGRKKSTVHTKPIITLPKVAAFQPNFPSAVTECPVIKCKAQEQRMLVSFKTLPKCLIFHFESGAGKGELQPLDFSLNDRHYKVTGIMTLEKGQDAPMDHFVSWIRDPNSDSWLECNDLNQDVLKFSVIPPQYIKLEDIYIIMFEAFDGKGTIEVQTPHSDSKEKFNLDDEEKDDTNIPFIDLSQDIEESDCKSEKTKGKSNDSASHGNCDELDFLKSICEDSETSEVAAIHAQQVEMMKHLDLRPKSSVLENEKKSHENVFSDKIQNVEERKNTLQDTLSPRYTEIIMKLAKQNDDIEQNNSCNKIVDTQSENVEENPLKLPRSFGKEFFSPSVTVTACREKDVSNSKDFSSNKNSSSSDLTYTTNKETGNSIKSISLDISGENSIDETKKILARRHVKLSEILADKKSVFLDENNQIPNTLKEIKKRESTNAENAVSSIVNNQNKSKVIAGKKKISSEADISKQLISNVKSDSFVKDSKKNFKEQPNIKLLMSPEIEIKVKNTSSEICPINKDSNVKEISKKNDLKNSPISVHLTSIVNKVQTKVKEGMDKNPKLSISKEVELSVKLPIEEKKKVSDLSNSSQNELVISANDCKPVKIMEHVQPVIDTKTMVTITQTHTETNLTVEGSGQQISGGKNSEKLFKKPVLRKNKTISEIVNTQNNVSLSSEDSEKFEDKNMLQSLPKSIQKIKKKNEKEFVKNFNLRKKNVKGTSIVVSEKNKEAAIADDLKIAKNEPSIQSDSKQASALYEKSVEHKLQENSKNIKHKRKLRKTKQTNISDFLEKKSEDNASLIQKKENQTKPCSIRLVKLTPDSLLQYTTTESITSISTEALSNEVSEINKPIEYGLNFNSVVTPEAKLYQTREKIEFSVKSTKSRRNPQNKLPLTNKKDQEEGKLSDTELKNSYKKTVFNDSSDVADSLKNNEINTRKSTRKRLNTLAAMSDTFIVNFDTESLATKKSDNISKKTKMNNLDKSSQEKESSEIMLGKSPKNIKIKRNCKNISNSTDINSTAVANIVSLQNLNEVVDESILQQSTQRITKKYVTRGINSKEAIIENSDLQVSKNVKSKRKRKSVEVDKNVEKIFIASENILNDVKKLEIVQNSSSEPVSNTNLHNNVEQDLPKGHLYSNNETDSHLSNGCDKTVHRLSRKRSLSIDTEKSKTGAAENVTNSKIAKNVHTIPSKKQSTVFVAKAIKSQSEDVNVTPTKRQYSTKFVTTKKSPSKENLQIVLVNPQKRPYSTDSPTISKESPEIIHLTPSKKSYSRDPVASELSPIENSFKNRDVTPSKRRSLDVVITPNKQSTTIAVQGESSAHKHKLVIDKQSIIAKESKCTRENIDYTVDCLADFYLSKVLFFFGNNLNEYKH